MTKSSTRKAAARKALPTHRKKARATSRHTNKVVSEKSHIRRHKIASKVNVAEVDIVRDAVHAPAGTVAQKREIDELSKNALQAVQESWRKSFGAAGEGATALNRRILDVAERNINAGFDLATSLAGAKSFTDVMASHAAYWRKQIGNLSAQTDEARKLTAQVGGPNKRKGAMDEGRRPKFQR